MLQKPVVPPVPSGYHTVTPYLIVPDAHGLFAFLSAAFGASEVRRTPTPDGQVLNIEALVGDSMVMVVQARAAHDARPASLYLYVPDVDTVYARAVAAGAVSLMEPADMFYGDRSAGVMDATGNHWWINSRRETLTSEELASSCCQEMWKRASGGELFSGWFDDTDTIVVCDAGVNFG